MASGWPTASRGCEVGTPSAAGPRWSTVWTPSAQRSVAVASMLCDELFEDGLGDGGFLLESSRASAAQVVADRYMRMTATCLAYAGGAAGAGSALMAFPPEVSAFVTAEGEVVVPPRVAAKMLRLVTLGVMDARRLRHIPIDLDMLVVLDAMNVATLAAERTGSAVGTGVGEGRRVDDAATLRPVSEVADAMGCSTRWVRKEIASGHLPARRVGSRWLIADSDFETYRHARSEGQHDDRHHRGRAVRGRHRRGRRVGRAGGTRSRGARRVARAARRERRRHRHRGRHRPAGEPRRFARLRHCDAEQGGAWPA